MNAKVFVIGKGIITAIGENPESMYKNLSESKSGLKSIHSFGNGFVQNPLAGEVEMTNQELTQSLLLDSNIFYSRTLLLGLYAVKQAIGNSGIKKEHLQNALFISANTVGGMDQTENYFTDYKNNPTSNRIDVVRHHDCGSSTQFIAKKLGIGGFYTTISTACSSSANSITFGARMIVSGKADMVIAGGTDALCKFTLNGFNSLMLLSNGPCRPFDQNRKGLNLGEGAAYLVLCSEKLAKIYTPITELAGWGNANDAYHQTASSPDGRGASLAIKETLQVAGIDPEQVDYINAHGTATSNNDLAESQAIKSIFKNPPPFSSTKPFTGHTLGAAGAIEAVISILALKTNTLFPSLNFAEPMEETQLVPTHYVANANINYVLSNSFGFGGNCSSLLFKKNLI